MLTNGNELMRETATRSNLHQRCRTFLVSSLALSLLSLLASVSLQAQITNVNPSETIAREIAPGQKQFHRVRLEAGRFFHVSITQQPGVDLIVTLYDTTHTRIAKVGGYKGYLKMAGLFPIDASLDVVSLSFVSNRNGIYEIEIDAQDTQISGHYQMKVADLHRASSEDSRRLEAERSFELGERLRFPARRLEDQRAAIKHYERALEIYREIKDERNEAQTLDAIGSAYKLLQNPEKSIESCEAALKIFQALGDLRGAAIVLRHLSGTHTGQLRLEQAL